MFYNKAFVLFCSAKAKGFGRTMFLPVTQQIVTRLHKQHTQAVLPGSTNTPLIASQVRRISWDVQLHKTITRAFDNQNSEKP